MMCWCILHTARGAAAAKILVLIPIAPLGKKNEPIMLCRQRPKRLFITAVTEGLAAPPQYFPVNAKINKEGYESLDKMLGKGPAAADSGGI